MPRSDGLYPNYINPNTLKWGQKHVSVGGLGINRFDLDFAKNWSNIYCFVSHIDVVFDILYKQGKPGQKVTPSTNI